MTCVAQSVANDVGCELQVNAERVGQSEHGLNDTLVIGREPGRFEDDTAQPPGVLAKPVLHGRRI